MPTLTETRWTFIWPSLTKRGPRSPSWRRYLVWSSHRRPTDPSWVSCRTPSQPCEKWQKETSFWKRYVDWHDLLMRIEAENHTDLACFFKMDSAYSGWNVMEIRIKQSERIAMNFIRIEAKKYIYTFFYIPPPPTCYDKTSFVRMEPLFDTL